MLNSTEISYSDVIAAYPTITHFHDHYTKQGALKKIFDD